jgi:hypothetical protein
MTACFGVWSRMYAPMRCADVSTRMPLPVCDSRYSPQRRVRPEPTQRAKRGAAATQPSSARTSPTQERPRRCRLLPPLPLLPLGDALPAERGALSKELLPLSPPPPRADRPAAAAAAAAAGRLGLPELPLEPPPPPPAPPLPANACDRREAAIVPTPVAVAAPAPPATRTAAAPTALPPLPLLVSSSSLPLAGPVAALLLLLPLRAPQPSVCSHELMRSRPGPVPAQYSKGAARRAPPRGAEMKMKT